MSDDYAYSDLKTRRQLTLRKSVLDYNNGHGVWEKIRTENGAKKYVTKYALKTRQKQVPEFYRHCGRFWGCSDAVRPKVLDHYYCTETELRSVLKMADHPLASAEYLPKLLWGVK